MGIKIESIDTTLNCLVSDEPMAEVPCGRCTLCCQILSPFLTPEEVSSGKYPISLVQSELTSGPVVTMFKNENGGCSMFQDGKCSIYEDRPISCRRFDCRKGHHPRTNSVAFEKFGVSTYHPLQQFVEVPE